LIGPPVFTGDPSISGGAGVDSHAPDAWADNDIPESDRSYDCWRCSEHRNVLPANRAVKPSAKEAATRGSKDELVNEIDS
jgi:hypothetical protein